VAHTLGFSSFTGVRSVTAESLAEPRRSRSPRPASGRGGSWPSPAGRLDKRTHSPCLILPA
jgi:hypothetical protein